MNDEALDLKGLSPELDEAFAARVLRVARAELVAEAPATSLPVRARRALVPVLLLSAGGCRTALTVAEIPKAYQAPEPKKP